MSEPMKATSDTPWHGSWKDRLKVKLAQLGFAGLEEFLRANPGVGYVSLAKDLGDANVAAIQLYSEQIRHGVESNNIRNVAMDCLVRFLNEYIRRGWKNGRHFQHRSASAFAVWSTSIASIAGGKTKETLSRVFDSLESMPIAVGWLPKDVDDEFILGAFEMGWPVGRPIV